MRSPLPWLMAHTPDPGKWQGWCGTWPGVILTGALSGALASLGLAPHSSWVAALGALLIVLLSLSALSSPWRILALILSFFAVLGSLGMSWLNFVMEGFGAVPPALSRLVVFLGSLLVGLPYAAWCAIGRRLLGPRNITLLLLVVPPGFLVGDLTCGLPFHHFPWLWVGYSAVEGPFAAFAPWVGALGISYLMVLTAAAAALAARRVYTCLPVAGAILAAGILLHGIAFTTLQGPRLQVGLVQ
nr:hypothetical protein [Succinivibrionaceae bacterium]